MSTAPAKPTCWRWLKRGIILVALFVGACVGLFAVNGLLLCHGETPIVEVTSHAAAEPLPIRGPVTLKLMAFNIAKCFAPKGGFAFEDRAVVAERVRKMAAILRDEQPDLVFLSETMIECTPCPVNQVAMLAEESGMHTWAFGENYNIGLPFYRAVGGNATLSRRPLTGIANPSLAGRKPFYSTKNSRRVLWCQTPINGKPVLLASVHNDSYSLDNSAIQVHEILSFCSQYDAIIAGDFNAQPGDAPVELLRKSGRFTGVVDGPPSFPADRPEKRIDLIFVPAGWEVIDYRVIATEVSDHRPVMATFRAK